MLVEEIHDMIWLIDAKGRFKYVSPRSISLLGYQPDEMIGRSPRNSSHLKMRKK